MAYDLRLPPNPTPSDCFEQIQPAMMEIQRLIISAPLSENGRGGLALLVATCAFAIAAGQLNKDPILGAQEVCDLIVGSMRPEIPALKVVK